MGKFQVKMSQRHERDIEDVWPNAHRTPSSGNKMEKADVQAPPVDGVAFMVECKSTQNSSYSIAKSIWNTVKSHANNKAWEMRPALCIRLYGQTNQDEAWGIREHTPETLPVELDLVVMELNDFIEFYVDYLRLKEEENEKD